MERLEAVPYLIQLDVGNALLEQRSKGINRARGQLEHVAGVAVNAGRMDMALKIERVLAS